MPLAPSPASRMSSISPAARSLPSALVNTVRMYSSEPSVTAMNWSASWRNSSSTTATSPRVTCFRLAIEPPTSCTSRADRYLKTSAAASSPSDIINTALRVTPSRGFPSFFILGHPGTHHHRDGARVFGGHVAGALQVVFVAIDSLGPSRGLGFALHFLAARLGLFGVYRRIQVVADGGPQPAVQPQGKGQAEHPGKHGLDQVEQFRITPEGRLYWLFVEMDITQVVRVAPRFGIAHGFAHQVGQLGQLFFGKRLGLDAAVGQVTDQHRIEQAIEHAHWLLDVADGAIDFV